MKKEKPRQQRCNLKINEKAEWKKIPQKETIVSMLYVNSTISVIDQALVNVKWRFFRGKRWEVRWKSSVKLIYKLTSCKKVQLSFSQQIHIFLYSATFRAKGFSSSSAVHLSYKTLIHRAVNKSKTSGFEWYETPNVWQENQSARYPAQHDLIPKQLRYKIICCK